MTTRNLRIVSRLKGLIFPSGTRKRRIIAGINRGLLMNLDLRTGSQKWVGLFEREIASSLNSFALKARSAIDVGASDGYYTLFFLRKKNIVRVLAIEPDAHFLNLLRANLTINQRGGDDHFLLIPQAVGSTEQGGVCVLDSVVDTLRFPCVIKMDVEGEEVEVIRGSPNLLARKDVFWVIETHSAELESRCIQALRVAALQTKVIKNAWWRVVLPELRSRDNRWVIAAHDLK